MMAQGAVVVEFADSQAFIAWQGKGVLAIIKTLFGVAVHCVSCDDTHIYKNKYKFVITSEGICSLSRDNHMLYEGGIEGDAAGILIDNMIHDLAADCAAGPVFHAAALAIYGKGVILPAKSGYGKSTLTAWLAQGEYDYLTDELVLIEAETLRIIGLHRPLYLRAPLLQFVAEHIGERQKAQRDGYDKGLFRSQRGMLVHIDHLRANNLYSQPAVTQIVFPRYLAKAPPRLERLSEAHACMRLMEHMVNARNLKNHGVQLASRLARRVPAYVLTYDDLDSAERLIGEALRA
jgi:hypothetical protein